MNNQTQKLMPLDEARKVLEAMSGMDWDFGDSLIDIEKRAIRAFLQAEAASRWNEGSGITAADYEEGLADHRRLVRELDVLLNGEGGAAKQASLCDIVGQLAAKKRNEGSGPQPKSRRLEDHILVFHNPCGGLVIGEFDDLICADCGVGMLLATAMKPQVVPAPPAIEDGKGGGA